MARWVRGSDHSIFVHLVGVFVAPQLDIGDSNKPTMFSKDILAKLAEQHEIRQRPLYSIEHGTRPQPAATTTPSAHNDGKGDFNSDPACNTHQTIAQFVMYIVLCGSGLHVNTFRWWQRRQEENLVECNMIVRPTRRRPPYHDYRGWNSSAWLGFRFRAPL